MTLETPHEEKENGPVGDVLRVTDTPLSYQPSAVGDAPSVIGVVPARVVTRLQIPEVELDIVALETIAPEQVLDEYVSAEGHGVDHEGDVEPPGKVYPMPE